MAGSAFCLHDDLVRASALVGRAPVIAVNGAAGEVKAAALYSGHPERFMEAPFRWIERQRKFGSDFTVHGSNLKRNGPLGYVDHYWEDCRGGGGSAWGARKLAWLMGFDPVILCGCPLVPGNYAGYKLGGLMTRQSVIDNLRREIEAESEWHEGACSMSGWTQQFLGSPSPAS